MWHDHKDYEDNEKEKLTPDMEDFLTNILNEVWVHNINPSEAYDEICELFGINSERNPL